MFHVEHIELNELSKCPICEKSKFSPFLECQDYTVSEKEFNIVQCDSCEFRFTNPIPTEDTIGSFYKSEDYISHTGTSRGIINWLYHRVRSYTLKKKLRLISGLTQERKLLDVGAGTGDFLKVFKDKGWAVEGLEPDADARKVCLEKNGIALRTIPEIYTLGNSSFPVITMWHVLEHVYNLKNEFAEVVSKLQPGGYLIIAVPNCDSWDAKHYHKFWAAYDLPRHLYHFRRNNIERLCSEFGLDLERIVPMKFDAYYISMLSEGYKGGGKLRGFLNGWRSNRRASGKNYSSLTYILRLKG